MKRLNGTIWGLLVGVGLLLAPAAHADSADREECTATEVPCMTARVKHDGVCGFGQCWSCDGDKPIAYSCRRCLTPEEAAAGAPPAPFEPAETCSNEDDDSGCTVHQLGTEQGIGVLFLALGLGAFLVARRRR